MECREQGDVEDRSDDAQWHQTSDKGCDGAYDWSDDEISELLRELSSSMAFDVEVIVWFDATHASPLREAV